MARIGLGRATCRGSWLAAVAVALGLCLAAPVHADAFDTALAEIDQALEKNPYQVPETNIQTCRAMRKTALLLRKMNQPERAYRRLKACRQLLGLEDFDRKGAMQAGPACVV